MNTVSKKRSSGELIELTSGKNLVVFSHHDFKEKVLLDTPYRGEEFCIILMKKGEIRMLYNLSEYTVGEYCLLLLAPKTLLEFQSISEDIEMTGMVFNEDFLLKSGFLLNAGNVIDILSPDVKSSFLLTKEEVDTLSCFFSLLQKKLSIEPLSSIDKKVMIHCFSTILYETGSVFQKYNTAYKAKLNRKEQLVLRFLNLLSIHFEKERSVTFYAGLLHVTPKYLTETVKEITGKTAGELIDLAVIMQAKILLQNPNLNIADVSSLLNFSEQSFFGKYFKRQVGLSPVQFRSSFIS